MLQPLSSPSALAVAELARSTRASSASIRWRFYHFARFRVACALPQPLSSPSALGRRHARSTRASPAPIRWRFHRCARCTAACALLQPLPSSSALGRRRARSLDAGVASFVTLAFPPLCAVQGCKCFAAAAAFVVGSDGPSPCSLYASVASFVTLAFLPLCAVQGCKCFAAAAAFVVGYGVGRRRARLTRASPASLRWRFHRFARCRAASALLQPLPPSSALMCRRRARSTRASPASLR